MSKYISLIVGFTLATFLMVAVAPTFSDHPVAAYAQYGKVKRDKDKTDDSSKGIEPKKEEPKKEDPKKDDSSRNKTNNNSRDDQSRKTNDKKDDSANNQSRPQTPKERDVVIQPRDKINDDSTVYRPKNSERTNDSKDKLVKKDEPSVVIVEPDNSRDKSGKYERVGEREQKTARHTYHPPYDRYPYDYFPAPPPAPPGHYPPYPRDTWPDEMKLTVGQALGRISRAWLKKEPELLLILLPEPEAKVKLYKNDKRLDDMTAQEFYVLTAQAIQEIETTKFKLKAKKYTWNKVTATGIHCYKTLDGKKVERNVFYTLELIDHVWTITETGFYIDEPENAKIISLMHKHPDIKVLAWIASLWSGHIILNQGNFSLCLIMAAYPDLIMAKHYAIF